MGRKSLCPSLGLFPICGNWWLYAIGLNDDVIKIGQTGHPISRLSGLCSKHRAKVKWVHLFGQIGTRLDALEVESYALSACALLGNRRVDLGTEYFSGLSRADVMFCVRSAYADYRATFDEAED